MSIKRAIHEIFGSGLYAEQEQYVQIQPFEQFPKRKNKHQEKLDAAIAWLGTHYCLHPNYSIEVNKERK